MTQKSLVKRHNQIKTENTNFIYHLLNSSLYNTFKHFLKLCIIVLILPGINVSNAQETYNLEVIFKKTRGPTTWFEGFGQALSTAGDVNSDGFDDILIGSPSGDVRGRCYLYYGGNPMDTLVDMIFYGDTAGDGFAISICSGYLNDDSFADIVVGLPNGWVNSMQPGKVYVYYGGLELDTIPDIIFVGQNNAELFGRSVACGDINNDGSDDLVVGQYWWNGGDGRVYVYYGGSLLDSTPDIIINGHNGESMGITVGSGGDANSDGYEDIVVGAFNNDEAGFWAGKIYVFFGGDPMNTIPDCWLHGEEAGHSLGLYNVSIVNNASDFDRVVTGTWHYEELGRSGKIYVLYGGDPMDTIPDVWMVGPTDTSGLGYWSASVGDVDGDGYGELLGGAPGAHNKGMAYLWRGALSMDTTADAWLACGTSGFTNIGDRVADADDVNGDGYAEVMFSNYTADSNQTVWICRYTGTVVTEQRIIGIGQNIMIHPNPFTQTLSIRFLVLDEMTRIKIYDVIGREVVSYRVNQRKINIDTKNLPYGVYFIQVEVGGDYTIRKVVKIK